MKIVEQIRDLIKDGRLKPGDKLPPEQILAEKFGTSRPSVREALSALEILGITESRGGKGNFIKDNLDTPLYEQKYRELEEEESPFEILEARKAVETEIVGLAAKKATKEDVVSIRESLDKMKSAMTNIPRIMEFDREFHINIAKAAHNSLLFSMITYLADLQKEKLWINLKEKSWSIPGRPQKYFEEHTEIFNAIKNKDSKDARKRMYDHLAEVEKDLLSD
jgi:GntR family transcriptional repressor for pyruvate dehydrogenase complex